ncbi:hypothetical protein BAUCODRAFT_37948, partial [Baudoinia panamericana UAMH 10762]
MFDFLAPASPFDAPSLLYQLLDQPVKTLIRVIDLFCMWLQPAPRPGRHPIRVVCISDTHCLKAAHVPDGDLLVHAGDLTNAGTPAEIQAQVDWLNSLPHQHKVVIAGNHDTYLDPRSRQTLSLQAREGGVDWKGLWYLQQSSVSLKFHRGQRKLKIYGAPQIPACGGEEFAFQYSRGEDAWIDSVPLDVDVLITHTPPKYHLDLPSALGCEYLLHEVWRVRPTLHVFGHIHAGKSDTFGWLKGGRELVCWDEGQKCLERAMSRPDGLMRGLVDPRGWLDVVRVTVYGVARVLWQTVWGGKTDRTCVVNASLMYCNTGQLRNAAQIVV